MRGRPIAVLLSVIAAGWVALAPSTASSQLTGPQISLAPDQGPAGSSFTVTGSGYPDQDQDCWVSIYWEWGIDDIEQVAGPVMLQPAGNGTYGFQATVTAPSSAEPGAYPVWVVDEVGMNQQCEPWGFNPLTFTVIVPTTTTSTTTTSTTTAPTSTTTSTSSTTTTTAPTTTTTQPPPPVTPPPTPPPRVPPTTRPSTTTTTSTTTSTTSTTTSTTSTTTTTTTTLPPTTTTIEVVDSALRPPGPDAALLLEPTAAPPGGQTTASGRGCDPDVLVTLWVADSPPVTTQSDADGRFGVRLPVGDLEPGRYEVVAECGTELRSAVDVIRHSAQGGAASSSAVLVFFVLVGVGIWQLRRVVDPTAIG